MLSKILNTHHAILIEGNPSTFLELVKNELIESGVLLASNPDVIFLSFEKFGIGESRQIIDMANGAPVRENKKRIIFSFESITNEAQNALLKIFEDPSPHVEFIIGTYTSDGLLPTLRSRLQIVRSNSLVSDDFTEVDNFLEKSVTAKMETVEAMLKEYKDVGNKFKIKSFLLTLHSKLEAMVMEDNTIKNKNALQVVETALEYIDDKSASVKILLESVVLGV